MIFKKDFCDFSLDLFDDEILKLKELFNIKVKGVRKDGKIKEVFSDFSLDFFDNEIDVKLKVKL